VLADRYLILDVLGSGGFGVVCKAKHIEIEKIVAIKLLRCSEKLSEQEIERFRREAKAASKLDHPNIIGVFDFGIDRGTVPYMVMDFLEGQSLDKILYKQKYLDMRQALHLFVQACDALGHAHRRGVIHRDIKPSNIMVVHSEHSPALLKIVDFGLARLMLESGRSAPKLTASGQVFGTPEYMSPEQCMGQPVDARSDIYSLGCIMYEVLTGVPVFDGENTLAVIHHHINQPPLPFAKAQPKYRIPLEMESIVLRALAKDPSTRYQSMQDLRNDLLALSRSDAPQRVDGSPDLTPERRWAPSINDQQPPIAKSAIVKRQPGKKERQLLSELEREEQNHGQQSPRLLPLLEKLANTYYKHGDYEESKSVYKRAIAIMRDAYGDSVGETELMRSLAKVYVKQERYDAAEALLLDALRMLQSLVGEDDPELAYCYEFLADVYIRQEKWSRAESCLNNAAPILSKTFSGHHIELAELLGRFGDLYFRQESYKEAEQCYGRALSVAEECLEHENLDLVGFLADLAETKRVLEDWETAVELYKKAFAIANSPANGESEELAETCSSLGLLYSELGEFAKAERYLKRGIAVYESIFGDDDPALVDALIALSDCYCEQEQFDEAIPVLKRGHSILKQAFGDNDSSLTSTYCRLGECYAETGQIDRAEHCFRKGLEVIESSSEQSGTQDAEEKGVALLYLGNFYVSMRRYEEAEPLLRQSLSLYEESFGHNNAKLVPVLQSLSHLCRYIGKRSEAQHFENWAKDIELTNG
jgi:serine/threonine protein kinase/lipopolysaccharide biosynthesis regulator YciM